MSFFQEQGPLKIVAFDAWNFDGSQSGTGGYSWAEVSDPGYANGKAMQCVPADGIRLEDTVPFSDRPTLDFQVSLEAGTYYFWTFGADGGTSWDTARIYIDEVPIGPLVSSDGGTPGNPTWGGEQGGGVRASFTIATPGSYKISVAMREAGFIVNRFFVCKEELFTPELSGPITTKDSGIRFLQQNTADGLVVFNAENYCGMRSAIAPSLNHFAMTRIDQTGYVGGNAVTPRPVISGSTNSFRDPPSNIAAEAPYVEYEVEFLFSGTHYLWVFATSPLTAPGNHNSLHVGLDSNNVSFGGEGLTGWLDVLPTPTIGIEGPPAIPAWSLELQGSPNYGEVGWEQPRIDIPAPGVYKIRLYMRESASSYNKVIISRNAAYRPNEPDPTDPGPPETRADVTGTVSYNEQEDTLTAVGDVEFEIAILYGPVQNADNSALGELPIPPGGGNRLMLAFTMGQDGSNARPHTSMTYGGQDTTLVTTNENAGNNHDVFNQLWSLDEGGIAAAGSPNSGFSRSGGAANALRMMAVVFDNAEFVVNDSAVLETSDASGTLPQIDEPADSYTLFMWVHDGGLSGLNISPIDAQYSQTFGLGSFAYTLVKNEVAQNRQWSWSASQNRDNVSIVANIKTRPQTGTDVSGSVSFTEENDSMISFGSLSNEGTISFTEADDVVVADGAVGGISGSIAYGEEDDTLSSFGVLTLFGSSAYTEEDDTISSSGIVSSVGVISYTEENDDMISIGSVGDDVSGSIVYTEEPDTMTAEAILLATGFSIILEADDTMAAEGGIFEPVTGTISYNEENDSLLALGKGCIPGSILYTEQNDSMLAFGSVGELFFENDINFSQPFSFADVNFNQLFTFSDVNLTGDL